MIENPIRHHIIFEQEGVDYTPEALCISLDNIMGTMHIKKKTAHGYIILEFERFIENSLYIGICPGAALVSSLA